MKHQYVVQNAPDLIPMYYEYLIIFIEIIKLNLDVEDLSLESQSVPNF